MAGGPELNEVQVDSAQPFEDVQISLVRLAEQLEAEMAAPIASAPAGPNELAGPPPLPVIEEVTPKPESPQSKEERKEDPKPAGLAGCKVAAIGFGRQDIGGLAATMNEQKARIEFLPRGAQNYGEFDLLILNAGSIETFKKEIASFRAALQSGVPSIVTGSRAILSTLREIGDQMPWDFVSKPFHMDELVWRSANLLARSRESNTPRQLPARIVVADQDPFARTLVESAMRRMGIECELAEDGEAAMALIERSQPGAVILDLTLPNRDGFQLMADIKRAPGRKPKVIVLSARQSEADILRAFALGADDYVTKPFSPLELSARLMRVLGVAQENA